MNGPFSLLLTLLSGVFAAGVVIHARAMGRSEQRSAHSQLAFICFLSAAYILIDSRLQSVQDIAYYERWCHVRTVFTAMFMALYPRFVAQATGSRGTFAVPFFAAGAVFLFAMSLVSASGRPWLPQIERMVPVLLPWGETVYQPRGPGNAWFFVFAPLWMLVGCYGFWRGLRSRGMSEVVGARALILSNLFFVIAIVNDASLERGLLEGPYLTGLIPPALTAGIWWQLSLVDRRRMESFRDLFVRSGDAILIHDAGSGAVVEANDAACQMFRRPRPQLVGATLDAIISPETPLPTSEFERRVHELRATGGAIRERRLRRSDGSEFTAELSLRAAMFEGHERIVASFRDLTDRTRVEQELIENERRLRAVIARSPIAIVEAAHDGGVVAVNPRFAALFGPCDRGASAFDLVLAAGVDAAAAPDRRERWRELLAQAGPAGGVIRSFATTVVDARGSAHGVDVCGVLTADGVVLFITDLSDVLAARDEIARREAFYRVLVEVASDGICVLDLDAAGEPAVAVWNRRMAQITGLAADQAAAPGWIDRLSADAATRARLRALLARLRDGTLRDEEWALTRRDGEVRTCSITAVELPRGAGPRRIMLALRDVTELARAELERRRADGVVRHAQKLESLGILAGGIAHDFNNILMPILGRAGLMGSRLGTDHPARGQLRDMEQAARRAADLCQQLLAYAGKGRTRTGPFALAPLVAEMAHVLSVSSAAGARLTTQFDEPLPPVLGDENQVRQVVMNLITNALDAVEANAGSVSLRLRRHRLEAATPAEAGMTLAPGEYVALEAADSGCGMDDSTRQRMFEPFFTTKPTGRGLGMAAVLGIVRSHGGGLQVDSVVGRGTTMRVFLPVFHGTVADPTPSAPHPVLRSGGTVLVVDDEDSIRRTTADMLVHLGFAVALAESGIEGVATFERDRERIRAVVLDLTMPDIDGGETLRRLRALDPRVPVILASGYSRHEVARLIGATEVAAFLQKPYDVDALAAALHAALAPAS